MTALTNPNQISQHEARRAIAACAQLFKENAELQARVMLINDEARKAERNLRAEIDGLERVHAETLVRVKMLVSWPTTLGLPPVNGLEELEAAEANRKKVEDARNDLTAYLASLEPAPLPEDHPGTDLAGNPIPE